MEGRTQEKEKKEKTDRFLEKDVLYFLSDAFPFFEARKETNDEAYCSSLRNK